jgi:dTDP-glucose 4,6-dehydratase
MNKTVLITGGCGFLGHHMVEHFLRMTDWNIVVVDALTYAGNLRRLEDINNWVSLKHRVKFIWHDIRSSFSDEIVNRIGHIDYMVHLAAETHVDNSLTDAVPFVATNVLGTVHLLDYLHKHCKDLEKGIVFSTDEVFGSAPEGVYYKEDDPIKPSNPYAASKAGQEAVTYSYVHAYNMPIMITRCMNLFGERQHPEKFLPKTIRSVLEKDTVVLHGRNSEDTSQRCWIHCREASDAVLFLLRNGLPKEFYHIVGEEHSVYELTQVIYEEIRSVVWKDLNVPPPMIINFVDYHKCRPGHDFRYAMSGEKLAKLGWKPTFNTIQSLRQAVNWCVQPSNQNWLFL